MNFTVYMSNDPFLSSLPATNPHSPHPITTDIATIDRLKKKVGFNQKWQVPAIRTNIIRHTDENTDTIDCGPMLHFNSYASETKTQNSSLDRIVLTQADKTVRSSPAAGPHQKAVNSFIKTLTKQIKTTYRYLTDFFRKCFYQKRKALVSVFDKVRLSGENKGRFFVCC
ncbi:MAG: hypothetical protein JW915_15870 [Chitinispirillaceae bacterium]|nr:hypothetical protein [Chitinispirillaceae bacterium]